MHPKKSWLNKKTLVVVVYLSVRRKRNYSSVLYSLDRVDHVEAHFHRVTSVVRRSLWKAAHAIIAIAQDLDPQAIVVAGQLIEPAE